MCHIANRFYIFSSPVSVACSAFSLCVLPDVSQHFLIYITFHYMYPIFWFRHMRSTIKCGWTIGVGYRKQLNIRLIVNNCDSESNQ